MDARVVDALTKSVSSDIGTLKRGGDELSSLLRSDQTTTVGTLCGVLSPQAAGQMDHTVRLMAALFLKNSLKRAWENEEQVNPQTRHLLKEQILSLVMQNDQSIRSVLFDVLEAMVMTDFPTDWPSLLPTLIDQYYKPFLQARISAKSRDSPHCDLSQILVAADVLLNVLNKYERIERSEQTLAELKYILSIAQESVLYMYKWFGEMYRSICMQPPSNDPNAAARSMQLCQGACHSLRIIKALHGVDLPAYFEDELAVHMTETIKLLACPPNPFAEGDADEKQIELKIAACEIIREYGQKYSEEFTPYTIDATKALVDAIALTPASYQYDGLVGTAMSSLGVISAVRWGPERDPFTHITGLCHTLCTSVILNHVALREEDLEACDDEPLLYAREDLEGLLRGARREGAAQLIKALLSHHEQEVCAELLNAIKAMLAESQHTARSIKERMLLREAATYLVTSISVKSSTRAKGVTEVSSVVSVTDFLNSQLLPILADSSTVDTPEAALVKGSALKFICVFRRFISSSDLGTLLPYVVKYLASANVYVYTNAAATLERLLTYKAPGEPFLDRQSVEVQKSLKAAVHPLFGHISLSTDCLDNEYVMRCLWRLLAVVKLDVPTQAARLNDLVTILREVARKPVNPIFCHYLFEAVAALCGIVAVTVGVSPQGHELHSYVLTTMTGIITEEESHAFVPYAYQVVAGLLGTLPTTVGNDIDTKAWATLYVGIFDGVLQKDRWTASNANIPGILSLISSFLRRPWILGAHMEQATGNMLTLFNYCLGNRRMAARITFEYVNNIILWMPENVLRVYARPLVACLSQYISKVGPAGHTSIPTECGVVSMSALQVKCDLIANHGGIGRREGDNRDPALDVPVLIDTQASRLEPYMNLYLLPVAGEIKSIPERKCLFATFCSLLTHPLLKANQHLAAKVRETFPVLAGTLRKDESNAARPTRQADAGDEMRERLLISMATEEEKGVADLSGTYNKLATTALASQEHPLTLLVPDSLVQELMK